MFENLHTRFNNESSNTLVKSQTTSNLQETAKNTKPIENTSSVGSTFNNNNNNNNNNSSRCGVTVSNNRTKHLISSYSPNSNTNTTHTLSPLVTNENKFNASLTKLNNNSNKEQLTQFIKDKEKSLYSVTNEYDQQYETFFKVAKKFHIEKLNNLKLTFKNQILKQQIYFETELLEISKECNRDYESYLIDNKNSIKISSNRTTSKTSSRKQHNSNGGKNCEKEKQLIKLYKTDMKRLIEYMREALLSSSDTLIEAFETCKILKSLEQVEKNFQKQNSNLKNSTKILLNQQNNVSSSCKNAANILNKNDKYNLIVLNEDEDDNNDERNDGTEQQSGNSNLEEKKLTDEQMQFNKYQTEMDEMMHVLDDIELQHLQRKDQLTSKTKLFNKLKSKFKYIENKYDTLSKQISNLKYESYVYRELWQEKQRLANTQHTQSCIKNKKFSEPNQKKTKNASSECSSSSNSSSDQETLNFYSASTLSSSISPSTSSRSSSTSSLSDCYQDAVESTTMLHSNSNTNSTSRVDGNRSSSASSSSSSLVSNHDDLSELINCSELDLDDFDDLNLNDTCSSAFKNNHDNKDDPLMFSSSSSSSCCFSSQDYNRKLNIIYNLINLHKSKLPSGSQSIKNTEFTLINNRNIIRADEEKIYLNDFSSSLCSNSNKTSYEKSVNDHENSHFESRDNSNSFNKNNIQNSISSLDLSECSTDGDRVIVENFNLKLDHDISNWLITRQIENMSVNKYKLPNGSIIKSGKVLQIKEPFQTDQIDFLLAIQKQNQLQQQHKSSSPSPNLKINKLCLKIITKLISPDGIVKSIHTQEVPQFYQEIFKYANLIQFL